MSDTKEPTYLAEIDELAIKTGASVTSPQLKLALKRASNRFAGAVGFPVHLVENQVVELDGDGTDTLLLPHPHIVGKPVVKIDGIEVTNFSISRQAGVLRRRGNVWPHDLGNIEVTYTSGFAEIPGDIQDAVLEQAETSYLAVAAYQTRTAGAESVTYSAISATGVTQRWIDCVERYRLSGDRA